MSWHLDDLACFDAHAARWTELSESQHCHPFLRVDLIKCAARHFGGHLLVGTYESGGDIRAMILLRSRSRWVYETFAPSQLPFALVVADPALDLSGALTELPSALPRNALLLSLMHVDTRYLDIPADGSVIRRIPYAETVSIEGVSTSSDYVASRSKKLRDNMKRYQKRLAGAFSSVDLKVLAATDEMRHVVEEHGELEAQGWKGREGSALSQSSAQTSFYVEALQGFADTGRAIGYQLIADGRIIASRFGIMSNGIFVFLKTAYSEDFRELAPGRALQWLAISHLLDDLRPTAIEFYTKANVDQLQWGTSNRMIWHYDVARSQSTAFAIDIARRLHRMFPRRSTGSK